MSYSPPKFKNEITLQLSRNESRCAIDDLEDQLASLGPDFVTRYPDHRPLQSQIGNWIGVDSDRIVVTAGGDESIDRVMRIALAGGKKKIVSHQPSFEMVDIYAANYGGQLDAVDWLEGEFPVESMIAKIDSETALVVVVSPNNPTGGWIPVAQILQIASVAGQHGCRLLVDNAYVEFADQNPTSELMANEHIMIVRTFSKAWGLAGLRVGYLIAPDAEFAETIRNASGPFPVSAVSLETARRAMTQYQQAMATNVSTIRTMDRSSTNLSPSVAANRIRHRAISFWPSSTMPTQPGRAWPRTAWVCENFRDPRLLKNRLRITCPTAPAEFLQLAQSLCRIHHADFGQFKNALFAKAGEIGSAPVTTDTRPAESPDRTAQVDRQTKETKIDLALNLDGKGQSEIETGIGFLDHMLTALTFHSGMDLRLKCIGDVHVDDHHTAEDCALALGTAIDQALGVRSGIQRFGFAYAPLDEALARTVLDLSGRPWPEIHLQLEREMVGAWACENITHFFQSLAMTLKCSLHVDVIRGTNDHHRVEAAFKSLAKALQQAIHRTDGAVPSTKGVL